MVGFLTLILPWKKKEKKGEFNLLSHSLSASSSPTHLNPKNTTLTLAESPSQKTHKKPETLFL